jgi:hypothetical protein
MAKAAAIPSTTATGPQAPMSIFRLELQQPCHGDARSGSACPMGTARTASYPNKNLRKP